MQYNDDDMHVEDAANAIATFAGERKAQHCTLLRIAAVVASART